MDSYDFMGELWIGELSGDSIRSLPPGRRTDDTKGDLARFHE